ncbi:hypothetical protein [Streptococcus zalophi]|uniref:hypothetical protein n=1 Tax=Streptococcus zalophi TaxID=640031 RepID=UPI00215BDD7B|nr:hypothetical protein [Streptococcus zalophi]MCR8966995.1 hypothetical protein [Streptococcus zalophi]
MIKTILSAFWTQLPMLIMIYAFYRILQSFKQKKQTKNIKIRIFLLKVWLLLGSIYTIWQFLTDIF